MYVYGALEADRKNGGSAYGVVPVPAENTGTTTGPVKKEPITPCSLGVSNQLGEELTLIHDGTEYALPPGNSTPDLTVYEEPFSLTIRASTNSKKVLGDRRTGATVQFTDEVTVDAVCGSRYSVGT